MTNKQEQNSFSAEMQRCEIKCTFLRAIVYDHIFNAPHGKSISSERRTENFMHKHT